MCFVDCKEEDLSSRTGRGGGGGEFYLGKQINKIEYEGTCTCAKIEVSQDTDYLMQTKM